MLQLNSSSGVNVINKQVFVKGDLVSENRNNVVSYWMCNGPVSRRGASATHFAWQFVSRLMWVGGGVFIS